MYTTCAAEAIFCCPTEKSHHLEALLISKDPLFNEEKISVRRTARCHITLEKSSKNYISLFQESPPEGYSRHPPHLSASCHRTFSTWWMAKCGSRVRLLLAEFTRGRGRGRAGWSAKRCHSIPDHRIDCKFNTKIDNSILLLYYLDKIFLIPTGDLWQVLAELYSEARL